jgi:hypothetical protein
MSVRTAGDTIHLEGVGDVADAEPLLSALLADRSRKVDLSGATRLHSAVIQLLLALRPKIVGAPDDAFHAAHIVPHLDTDIG